jgi:hypothetical protein
MSRFAGSIVAFLFASAMGRNAEAMTFYNNSNRNVFVYVVVGHDVYEQESGSFRRDLEPGKSWGYSPGNLHMQAQQDYTFFVWTSYDAWLKAEGLSAFLSALSDEYHVIDSWLRESSTYYDPRNWPDGLLMIAEGFDDDDYWLRYHGKGRSPFAEKGGCTCTGAGWTRSGYGCSGKDWGLRDALPWAKPTTRRPYPDKACAKPKREVHKKAVKHRKNTRVFQGCPKGQFWDVKGGNGLLGACYSCASGYRRTLAPVDAAKSCAKTIPAQYKASTLFRSQLSPP